MVNSVTDSTFKVEVETAKGLVIVDFWAPWCGPCRAYAPILEEVQNLRKDVKILKLNIDENVESATKFGIRSIPTIVAFYDGKKIDTKVGVLQRQQLEEAIDSYLRANN